MLTLTATVMNVFATSEFKDKLTGDITPAGHKAQLQYTEAVRAGGEKIVLDDFNIHDQGKAFTDCIGKMVQVPVGIYLDQSSKKPKLYIPKGSLPVVRSAPLQKVA